MAKKMKRNISSGGQAIPAKSTTPAAAPAAVARPSTSFAASRPSYTTEFKPDYSLVVSDLKRIGGLAAVFTVILIGLSFFLR